MTALALFLVAILTLPGTGRGAEDAEKPRYNVLFIAVDDLRPQLGCYGDESIRSPHIDRLAQRGIVFSRAYCQQALCNPSRASLLTGLRPDTTRIYDLSTHFRANIPDVVTLPEQFKRHGYHTQGLSKIFHGGLDDPKSWSAPHWMPTARTYFDEETRKQIRKTTQELESQGIATQKRPLEVDPATGTVLKLSGRRTVHGPAWEAPDVADNALYDGQTTDRAVKLLGEFKNQDKPFFLAVGYIRPHLPFVSPRRYFDLYPPASAMPLARNPFPPRGVPKVALYDSLELRGYTDVPDSGPISEETRRDLLRAYRASTSFIDAQVGRLLDELQRQGIADRTIVILWGDHGWHLGEHDIWGKMTNFEIATRVPMIVSAPNQKHPGSRTNALAEFVDIYPTLCELCDLPAPKSLEGSSLVPVMNEPTRPWKKAAFSQYPRSGGRMGHTMRTDRYRYTEWKKGDKIVARELYDYQTDPEGNVNVARDPENRELVAELSRELAVGWRGALPAGRDSN